MLNLKNMIQQKTSSNKKTGLKTAAFCTAVMLSFVASAGFEKGIPNVYGEVTATNISDMTKYQLSDYVKETAGYIQKTLSDPTVSSVGGEWAVMAFARFDEIAKNTEFYNKYYKNLCGYLKENNGIMHDKKYTEYSRVILAVTSMGKNPKDVDGVNLITPIADFNKTIWQGINGAIWAVIAIDSGSYTLPDNSAAEVQASLDMYIKHILDNQTEDGGWNLSGDTADADMTAMAIIALSKHMDNKDVSNAVNKAVDRLSQMQNEDGGFSNGGSPTAESCAQVVTALCEVGVSPNDEKFIKNGKSVLDKLLEYKTESGGFKHLETDLSENQMATEQSFCAVVAADRFLKGKNSFYDMTDVNKKNDIQENNTSDFGLPNKNTDIKKSEIKYQGKTFDDILGHKNQTVIEELTSRGIINGKSEEVFEPNSTMTRAEFAAIVTRGLGLTRKDEINFWDVTDNDWFYDYIGCAYKYGIIKGVSDNEFNPNGTITREEAAVMVVRAASLCGCDIKIAEGEAKDILVAFFDYVKLSDWAFDSAAVCFKLGIFSYDMENINPNEAITRGEIADVLYNTLKKANLL